MASRITVQAPGDGPRLAAAVEAALAAFSRIERDCTRFGTTSALVRANRQPGCWHRVPPTLFAALREAVAAYRRTGGLFDPRVHDSLVELGYDRTFTEVEAADRGPADGRAGRLGPWSPRLVPGARLVHLGGSPADLGGIGKGLALRDASRRLRRSTADFLIEAGGDVYASGGPTADSAWLIGVESPSGDAGPAAVLEARDVAVATSSVRIRRWRAGDATVHHLIDPRTGAPGGGDLLSVTVVHPDPAEAEVWSKALFLHGAEGIAEAAAARRLPALWIDRQGVVARSGPMNRFVSWPAR